MTVPRKSAYEYRKVSESDEETLQRASSDGGDAPRPLTEPRRLSASPLRLLCVIAAAVVCLSLAAAGGFVVGSMALRTAQPYNNAQGVCWNSGEDMDGGDALQGQIEDCGETPAQARARGCRYDVMHQQWVPAACYDEEHSEMYLSTYRWKWWYDMDAEREMSDEVMRKGEHEVAFMDDDYHRRHCAFIWEVTTRAFQQQKPLLDEWLSYKHVHHCNRLFLSPPWNATKQGHLNSVETHSGYGRCAPYRVWATREMPE